MADEITISAILRCENGNLSVRRDSGSSRFTQTAIGRAGGAQSVGFAAHEAVAVGDVSTLGWAYFKNLDTTNFVEIGVDVAATFYPLVRLEAGEAALFRLSPSATVYAKANTAAVLLDCEILED